MRKLFVATATVAIFALLVTPALAGNGKGGGKGGNGGSTTLTTASLRLNDSAPSYGDLVTFTADYVIPDGTKYSVGVGVKCWAVEGDPFYMHAQFTQAPAPFSPMFKLGPSSVSTTDGTYWWDSGGAHCTAALFYYTWQGQTQSGPFSLDSMSFEVAA